MSYQELRDIQALILKVYNEKNFTDDEQSKRYSKMTADIQIGLSKSSILIKDKGV